MIDRPCSNEQWHLLLPAASVPHMRLAGRTLALCACIALLGGATSAGAATRGAAVKTYDVDGVRTSLDRSAVVATGAAIIEVDHASVLVTASASDLRKLRRLRYRVTRHVQPHTGPAKKGGLQARAAGFPAADGNYHDYAEVTAETAQAVADYPGLVTRQSIGTSYQGRELWALKVSDNVSTDEPEPEVLFTANQHAREHLTVEMALYLLKELTTKYASDARIKNIVDTREIWIIPTVNPDGAEFDVSTGSYALWRKNRQPNAGTTAIGTDLNRNWGFQWGCCGGSSATPSSETYRGPAAFSANETQRVRDFVQGRRTCATCGGVQQIKTGIDFHTYAELVLWPYGYTTADTTPTMTADVRNTFATLGQNMAGTNGYTPEQASDLYIADGAIDDWLWGTEGIFGYTFEMYPTTSNPGFYPPDEAIPAQTTRNREAVLRLLEISDCVYKAIGKETQYCGVPSTTLFSDDFETNKNWVVGSPSDTATLGKWERGDPAATTSGGAKQLGTTVSGVNDLVTGRLAGAGAGDYDVDGGLTTISSPPIALTGGTSYTLSFSYYLAHASNSSTADYLRVKVAGTTTSTVFQEPGSTLNDDGVWATTTVTIPPAFNGQTVRIVIEAADLATASLVEAAIDNVVVKR
jgi:carboxypeptidase T